MLFSAKDADLSAEASAAKDGFAATGCEVVVAVVTAVEAVTVAVQLSLPFTTAFSGGTAGGLSGSVVEEFLSGLVIVEALGTDGLDVDGTDVRFSATKTRIETKKLLERFFADER